MNLKFFLKTSKEYTELCDQHGWIVSWDGYFAYIGGIRDACKNGLHKNTRMLAHPGFTKSVMKKSIIIF